MSLHHPAKLTSLSHGGGCGCKIAPAVLKRLLSTIPQAQNSELLHGHQTSDDAAVYRIDAQRALVTTTDFFPPMVDDPFDFGRIAAANALSDIYAMGGTPALALNVLGVPSDKVSEEHIAQILQGGQATCEQAACVIAGGHSIVSNEAFYGLACIGFVDLERILYNSTARADDVLIISKPLGIGVLSNAIKKGLLDETQYAEFLSLTTQINQVGPVLAAIEGVHAMSDVTGFGLLGHTLEMCRPATLDATIAFDQVPRIGSASALVAQSVSTGAATRNWEAVADHVTLDIDCDVTQSLLTDPQTNGGLLIACHREVGQQVVDTLHQHSFSHACYIGTLASSQGDVQIRVR